MAGFQRAVKVEAKLRLALAGPSGAGKTYTALTVATALANGGPVALIDTERGSASKYADLFGFDVLELDNFHPDKYVEAIREAEASGYAVLVIDSLTHAWTGKDGLLEQVERLAKLKHGGNTFKAWADATPIQNRFIDALTGAKLHVIATMRSKTEYVVETNDRGKATPRKVGTAPIQRDGMEYEFDLFGELDQDNTLVIHKSRCPQLAGAVIAKPGKPLADTLATWLAGAPVASGETPARRTLPTHMERFQQPEAIVEPEATEKQWASIRKACEILGKPVPAGPLKESAARKLLDALTNEYKARQNGNGQGQNGADLRAATGHPRP